MARTDIIEGEPCMGTESCEELALVHSMHAAAGIESGFEAAWESILHRLRRRVGAPVAALSTYCFTSGEGSILCESPVDAGFAACYAEQFCVRNPWFLSSDDFEAGRVLVDADLIGSVQLERTDFFRKFLVPQGLRHWLCGVISRHGDKAFYIEFLRREEQGVFDGRARERLRQMLEHIQLAMRNHWRVRHSDDLGKVLRGVIDRTSRAIFLVDRHAALLHGNLASRELLQDFDGLQLQGGCLCSSLPMHNRALLEGIRDVADSREHGIEPNVIVTLPGSNSELTAIVQIEYAGEFCCAASGQSSSTVVVSTCSPIRRHDPATCLFANLYALTPAQSRLSALVFSGYSLQDAAEHLNVSENTLRSHLKQIYAKTDTHGQMEMVHLHARTCAEAF